MKIAIIGAGAMGGAIAEGLLARASGEVSLYVSNPSSAPFETLSASGAIVSSDNREVAGEADVLIIAVKPWVVETVIREIREIDSFNEKLLIVVAAGIKGVQLLEWVSSDCGICPSVVIGMPNTAVSVGESMTFLVPVNARENEMSVAKRIFDFMGSTLVIDEAHLPAATALASCCIAYALRYMRAAVEGGVELGFKADVAQRIVAQTVLGASELLRLPGTHAEKEIDKVTTPGGITIRGLNEMEHAGFSSAVIRGLKASVITEK